MINLRPALVIIDGKIGVGLKDSDLTFALYRDSTRGDVSDATVRKGNAGVGYVGLFGQHRHADGLHPIDGRAYEAGDDIDIVNH